MTKELTIGERLERAKSVTNIKVTRRNEPNITLIAKAFLNYNKNDK